ncbi:MAG: MarR family transcriptional regulator [Thermoprotei archaeon]
MGDSVKIDEPTLWRDFAQAMRAVQRLLDNRLKVLGVGYQEFKVLAELAASGRLPMAKLAERIMFTQAGVTYLVDRLEEQEYAVRERSSEDRRIIYVKITEKGKKVFEEGLRITQETTREIFENLSQEELTNLHKTLTKIMENTEKNRRLSTYGEPP